MADAIRSYPVKVEEVHSGDDLLLMVDLGIDKLFKKVRCRLLGVDTPNAYKAKSDSEAGVIRDEVRKLLTDSECRVEVQTEGKGGWMVFLYAKSHKTNSEICINEFLKQRGFVYQGRVDGSVKV